MKIGPQLLADLQIGLDDLPVLDEANSSWADELPPPRENPEEVTVEIHTETSTDGPKTTKSTTITVTRTVVSIDTENVGAQRAAG